jgi:hypothetical protein
MSFVQDLLEPEYHKARSYRLYLVNRRQSRAHNVALAAAFGVPSSADIDTVRDRLNDVRDSMLNRMFDMARFERRFPVYGVITDEHYCNQRSLMGAFKACCWCRPSGVIYPPKTQKKKMHFCGHFNFCPACWGRVVQRQFEQYEDLVGLFRGNRRRDLFAVTHITEEFIPYAAVHPLQHADDETYAAAVELISKVLHRYKGYVAERQRSVRRNTAAALWRLVPFATEGGWLVQLRQFLLARTVKRLPTISRRPSRIVQSDVIELAGEISDEAVMSFISFSMYPFAHFTADLDLTSASLSAAAKQRMLGGSGKFRSAGNGLIVRARRSSLLKVGKHARRASK